jgi:predicted DNA-binding transcriptional regulator AlpA
MSETLEIPKDMPDRVLNYREAKVVAGVSVDSLRRAAKREELKLTRLSPRRVGIRKSELERWMQECTA